MFSTIKAWAIDQLFIKQPRLRALVTRLIYGSGPRQVSLFGTALTVNAQLENGYFRAFQRSRTSSLWRDESATLCALFAILRPGDLFVDAGANIGLFACTLARLPGVKCIAFEANPDTFQRLKTNADLHGVEARNIALSDRNDCELEFASGAVSHVFAANAHRNRYHAGSTVRLRTHTLDSQLQGAQSIVLKIDVEGHEPEVLRGALHLLEAGAIEGVLLDASPETKAAAKELATRGFLLLNPSTFRPATYADPVILALSSSRSKLLTLPAEVTSL